MIKRRLAALADQSQPIRDWIDRKVAIFNGKPGDPASFELIDELLEHQCYRLSYWRVGSDEINYRRFFDVNDLAALAMEREEVFEATHALVFRLVADGKVDGLRIDHPDGLFDPKAYFRRLQDHTIIARALDKLSKPATSKMTSNGTTSSDSFVIDLRLGMFQQATNFGATCRSMSPSKRSLPRTNDSLPSGRSTAPADMTFSTRSTACSSMIIRSAPVSRLYREIAPDAMPFSELIYRKKLLIVQLSLASELNMLTHELDRLAQKSRRSRDFTFNALRDALQEVIACFPVYRSYVDLAGASPTDRRYVESAVRRARSRNPLMSGRVFRFVRDMVIGDSPDILGESDQALRQRFAGKFQQVTAPVMAKGVEDTAFYVDQRLISLNEVGGDPARFGIRPEALHAFNQNQQLNWPFAPSSVVHP